MKTIMKQLVAGMFVATASLMTSAVSIVETFDLDTAGFGPNTTSSVVVHIADGGNPGGYILTRKDLTPPVFDIGAFTGNPQFTGDYAATGINFFSVDLNFFTDNIEGAWVRFRPGPAANGWRFPLTETFPTDVWNTYDVMFDPAWGDLDAYAAGWLTDHDIDPLAIPSPSFASVMSSVDSLEVRIASTGATLVGIDNVRIASVPDSSNLLAEGAGIAMLLFLAGRLGRRRSDASA
jgi:hypothetical protein